MSTTLRWTRHPDFPDAKRPHRAHPTDAGVDVFCAEDVTVRPGEVLKCRTGVCVHPEPGPEADSFGFNRPGGWTFACFVWDKSGLAGRGLTTLGGVIDDPYTGEILVVVGNMLTYPALRVLASAPDAGALLETGDAEFRARLDALLESADPDLKARLAAYRAMRRQAIDSMFNVEVKAGEKLTQLVVQRVELPIVEDEPRELAATVRGAGGFASTGA